MHADPDHQLGDVVRRLSQLRYALGETAYSRAIHEVLGTIGGVAMHEAERRARSRRDRGGGWPPGGKVVPFPGRPPPDPSDGPDRRPDRCDSHGPPSTGP